MKEKKERGREDKGRLVQYIAECCRSGLAPGPYILLPLSFLTSWSPDL